MKLLTDIKFVLDNQYQQIVSKQCHYLREIVARALLFLERD